jgi:hypothetical protein
VFGCFDNVKRFCSLVIIKRQSLRHAKRIIKLVISNLGKLTAMKSAGKIRIFKMNILGICVSLLLLTVFNWPAVAADKDPFAVLRGNWGGSGTMLLKDGAKERLTCKARYSGSASQLRLQINCKSNSNKVNMKARLSANGRRLLGVWEEETFKALGTIAGKIDENKITFKIAGNVLGDMVVRYSKSRQNISIKTNGVALQSIKMRLSRR